MNLATTTAQTTGEGTDTVTNIENATGGSGSDFPHRQRRRQRPGRGSGNDTLDGGDGNDTLRGSDGNDTLRSSLGDDSFDGGTGKDVIEFGLATSGVTVNLGSTSAQSTGQGNDTLANLENANLSSSTTTITGLRASATS
ncbi:MAG: hypothetical protein U0V56_00990 [Actinomycetota bacterium]